MIFPMTNVFHDFSQRRRRPFASSPFVVAAVATSVVVILLVASSSSLSRLFGVVGVFDPSSSSENHEGWRLALSRGRIIDGAATKDRGNNDGGTTPSLSTKKKSKKKDAEEIVIATMVPSTVDNHNNNINDDEDSSFFDCDRPGATCQYLNPGKFFRDYFQQQRRRHHHHHSDQKLHPSSSASNSTLGEGNNTDRSVDGGLFFGNTGIGSGEYFRWRKEVGLENPNLPALTTLTWWAEGAEEVHHEQEIKEEGETRRRMTHSDGGDESNNHNGEGGNGDHEEAAAAASSLLHDYRYHELPRDASFIHVHKCGGTSVQKAMRARAKLIDRTRVHFFPRPPPGDDGSHSGKAGDDDDAKHRRAGTNTYANSTQLEGDVIVVATKARVRTYKHSVGGGSRATKDAHDAERKDLVRQIALAQRRERRWRRRRDGGGSRSDVGGEIDGTGGGGNGGNGGGRPPPFPAFATVRDPIARFLSAVQQVMHYNTDLRTKCLSEAPPANQHNVIDGEAAAKEARRSTIRCAVRDRAENHYKYRGDVHLLPMASHFRLLDTGGERNVDVDDDDDDNIDIGDDEHGVTVSVFSLEEEDGGMTDLLRYIAGNNDKIDSYDGSNDSGSHHDSTKDVPHARDRSDERYATSATLSRLTVDDVDDESFRKLCELYDVDVEMMRALGFGGVAVEKCPKS